MGTAGGLSTKGVAFAVNSSWTGDGEGSGRPQLTRESRFLMAA